jgi:hypothetical protein
MSEGRKKMSIEKTETGKAADDQELTCSHGQDESKSIVKTIVRQSQLPDRPETPGEESEIAASVTDISDMYSLVDFVKTIGSKQQHLKLFLLRKDDQDHDDKS